MMRQSLLSLFLLFLSLSSLNVAQEEVMDLDLEEDVVQDVELGTEGDPVASNDDSQQRGSEETPKAAASYEIPVTPETKSNQSKAEEGEPSAEDLSSSEKNNATATATEKNNATATETESAAKEQQQSTSKKDVKAPVQTGPFIDLLGPQLLSLEMIDETHAQLMPHYTNDALRNKKVVGLYFSADWCGPCRQFTPELVGFYNKMNARRGKKDEFEIVWVSRCRDMNSFGQYFTQMGKWFALPPEDAMGQRGQRLSDKYKVKGIPTLVLLDDLGNVITKDGRNKIPADKSGIGFPWRNPIANIYVTVLPRSVRLMMKSQIVTVKDKMIQRFKQIFSLKRPSLA